MSASTHQIRVQAKDQTAAAFDSVKNRAAATGARIRSMLGGALAAAGAYLGLRSVKAGVDELGHLSDVAQKTSTSVDELTQTASALNVLGIQNMSVEQLAKSFDYLQKTTGRTGLAGFKQTIGELGKITDVAKRGQEAMRIFGRSGMEFMPLINGARDSVDALSTVIQAMPAIPQSAAAAGDACSDAMSIASAQMKSIWLQGIGAVCGWFDSQFVGGIREAALAAGNWLEYYAKKSVLSVVNTYSKIQGFLKRYGDFFGAMVGTKMAGGTWGESFDAAANAYSDSAKEYDDLAKELDEKEAERTERWRKSYEERAKAIKEWGEAYKNAAKSTKQRQAMDLAVAAKKPTIRNELIMGGSARSLTTAVFGPQMQSETKKQTGLLEKIAENTENTADNTEKAAEAEDFMEI